MLLSMFEVVASVASSIGTSATFAKSHFRPCFLFVASGSALAVLQSFDCCLGTMIQRGTKCTVVDLRNKLMDFVK